VALEAAMADHRGDEPGEAPPAGSSNERNGSSAKPVRTEIGDVRLAVPRDRAGTFTPRIVPKHAHRVDGFGEAIISLYAKGLTTGRFRHIRAGSTRSRCREMRGQLSRSDPPRGPCRSRGRWRAR